MLPLQTYLNQFAFGSTTYSDLWDHLQMVSTVGVLDWRSLLMSIPVSCPQVNVVMEFWIFYPRLCMLPAGLLVSPTAQKPARW